MHIALFQRLFFSPLANPLLDVILTFQQQL
jgi:hypothetical protein